MEVIKFYRQFFICPSFYVILMHKYGVSDLKYRYGILSDD